jgi:hypothetical protein
MQGTFSCRLAFVKQVRYDWVVLQRDYPDQVCSIARSLEVIGERWTLLILRDAVLGAERFEEFQDSLGIASNGSSCCATTGCSSAYPTRRAPAARDTRSRTRAASSRPPSSC